MILPEHFAGLRVVDDRGFGAHVRHFAAELVNAEARRLQFLELAGARGGAGTAPVARDARARSTQNTAFFLAVTFVVAARAGVFCADGAAAAVCATANAGAQVAITAAAVTDTNIFLTRFSFAIEKMNEL